ncbi:hypothetical protein F4703DRAFT_1836843 [Phycomyces blakesleeanus]
MSVLLSLVAGKTIYVWFDLEPFFFLFCTETSGTGSLYCLLIDSKSSRIIYTLLLLWYASLVCLLPLLRDEIRWLR